MSQQTLVVKIPRDAHTALRGRLATGSFEFKRVPYAHFCAQGEGVTATLYESGKLVVQGRDPAVFLARYTDLDAPTQQREEERRAVELPAESIVGADETGKGDYFGPLVVACVRVVPERAQELVDQGVADSKKLTDTRALKISAWLRGEVPYALRRLDPPAYNAAREKHGNLNLMLAELHAEAIRELAEPGEHVLVDQFADEELMRRALSDADIRLEQAPRAERNVAVAAASLIARAEFLLALKEMSAACGVELAKGAGAPVDQVGARYVKEHGFEALGEVAKLHFKNTEKIRARLYGRS